MPKGVYKRTKEHIECMRQNNLGSKNPMFCKSNKWGNHTEISKEKMSKAHQGKKLSDEHRKNISKSHKGLNVWSKGRNLSDETKKKISKNNAKFWLGKKLSKEHKRELSKSAKKNGIVPPCRKGKRISEESRRKMSEARRGEKNSSWRGGISFEPYSIDWTETLRRSIRERDHYICQLCGQTQGDIALDVHHIDYNKQNCNPNNLITLCHSCHTKTGFNREYWIEYFNNNL